MLSKEASSFAQGILEESNVSYDTVYGFDVLTLLTIISVAIEIIKFLYPYFSDLNRLPWWKKVAIRMKLVSKFGLAKARDIEKSLYGKIKIMKKEQADALVNLIV